MSLLDVVKQLTKSGRFVVTHPNQIRWVPLWLRERKAGPFESKKPWWPYDMIDFMEAALPSAPRVFEYGGGGSSLWLVSHGSDLTVVEHHPEWTDQLRAGLPGSVELIQAPVADSGTLVSPVENGYFDDYVSSIAKYPDESFDLVIVDGRCRVDCTLQSKPKIRPGGMLLLDDSDRERYEGAHRAMHGWDKISISGLKIGSNVPATTTVWTRPKEDVLP